MWEQAEVTVVSRVIPVMLADLQELTPIHSSNCLSAGEGTHRETNAHKKDTHTAPHLAPHWHRSCFFHKEKPLSAKLRHFLHVNEQDEISIVI